MDVTCHFKVTEMDLTPTIRSTKIYVGYTPPKPRMQSSPPGWHYIHFFKVGELGNPNLNLCMPLGILGGRSNDLPAGRSRCRMWSNDSSRRTAQTAVGSGFKDQCIYIYTYVYIEHIEYTVWILDIGAIQILYIMYHKYIYIYVSYIICSVHKNQCIFWFWHRVWLKHFFAKGNCAFQHAPMIPCCDTFHSWPNKMKGKSGLLGPRTGNQFFLKNSWIVYC